jgi:hypothetical protein
MDERSSAGEAPFGEDRQFETSHARVRYFVLPLEIETIALFMQVKKCPSCYSIFTTGQS